MNSMSRVAPRGWRNGVTVPRPSGTCPPAWCVAMYQWLPATSFTPASRSPYG